MLDLFPYLRATLKDHTYFSSTLEGFEDSEGRFKVYKGDEAPTNETPFITIDIKPGGQDQRNAWAAPIVMFNVTGNDTEWSTLYVIAEKIREIFTGTNALSVLTVGATPIQYQTIGDVLFDEGRNPVTEQVVVSVGMAFGLIPS